MFFCKKKFKCKILFLKFKRTMLQLKKFNISTDELNFIPLQGYKNYLSLQRDAFLFYLIGTAQEEPSIFKNL